MREQSFDVLNVSLALVIELQGVLLDPTSTA